VGRSLREKAVMATLGVIVLYAIAVATWFLSAEGSWRKAARGYAKAKVVYQGEVKLIGEKRKWTEAYENEKKAMPTCKVGEATDTIWLPMLDGFAMTNHIAISSSQAGAEIEAGDVLELPIEVKSWEGSLESLARFMYELENTEEGMFDITRLSVKPISSKPGYLRGSFTLNCAYMREK